MQGDTIQMKTYFTKQGCRVTEVIREHDDDWEWELILAVDGRPEVNVNECPECGYEIRSGALSCLTCSEVRMFD